MKTLLLLRHAKSSWSEPGMADHDRPLNERGKREAPLVGQEFRERDLQPDLVLSSTAKRAQKTAKKVLDAGGFTTELRLVDELYLAAPSTYVAVLRKLPAEVNCALVIGHNPGLEDLVKTLTGQRHHLGTATSVQITLPINSWSMLRTDTPGTLDWLWRPAEDAEES